MTHDIPDGFLRYDEHNAEYKRTLATLGLELPEGFVLPGSAYIDPHESDVIYEEGAGEVGAHFAWLTAVEEAAVGAHIRGDDRAARHWLHTAAQFTETGTFDQYNDHDVPVSWRQAVIAPALDGNFTPLAADLIVNRPIRSSALAER